MNTLFKSVGISKQAFHQRRQRMLLHQEQWAQLLPIVEQWRITRPGESVRWLHEDLSLSSIGRDQFEQLCFDNGFRVEVSRNRFKTTHSNYPLPFPNLLEGLKLTGVNQVWVSDITYFQLYQKMGYITVWMDLFSRFIVGYHASESLRTEQTTLPALRQAIKLRNPAPGLILHSDGGGQYYSKQLLTLCHKYGLKNSMGRGVYENAHVERLHHTIKNQYLKHYNPCTLQELKELLGKAVYHYNFKRKHQSLERKTPYQYEAILSLPHKIMQHKTYHTKHHALTMI